MAVNRAANKRLNEWAKGKNPLLALVAAQLATNSSFIPDLLRILSQGGPDLAKFKPLPPIEQWMIYHRHHREFCANLIDSFIKPAENEEVVKPSEAMFGIDALLRTISRPKPNERTKLKAEFETDEGKKLAEEITGMVNQYLHLAWRDILDPNAGDPAADDAGFQRAFDNGSLQFLLCVWLPCLILATDFPSRLMHRARKGDLGALEHLLRIDKALLQDPWVAEEVRQAWMTPRRARFKRLANTIAGKPQELKPKAVKTRVAGLIRRYFMMSGDGKSTDIRELFDIARHIETNGKERVDSDLPKSPETMGKAVQRSGKLWDSLLKAYTDKK